MHTSMSSTAFKSWLNSYLLFEPSTFNAIQRRFIALQLWMYWMLVPYVV